MAGKWVSSDNLVVLEDNSKQVSQAIREAIRRGLRRIGERAVKYATARVPVRTGNLKSSISYDSDDEQVIIGSDVSYASFVELGTVKMRARPFLVPALRDHAAEYRDILEDSLRNA